MALITSDCAPFRYNAWDNDADAENDGAPLAAGGGGGGSDDEFWDVSSQQDVRTRSRTKEMACGWVRHGGDHLSLAARSRAAPGRGGRVAAAG